MNPRVVDTPGCSRVASGVVRVLDRDGPVTLGYLSRALGVPQADVDRAVAYLAEGAIVDLRGEKICFVKKFRVEVVPA